MKSKVGDKVIVSDKCEEVGLIGTTGVVKSVLAGGCYMVESGYGLDVFYWYELELANEQ